MPFRWERVRRALGETLVEKDIAALQQVCNGGRELELFCLLDLHTYARRRLKDDGWSSKQILGSHALPSMLLADVRAKLAETFAVGQHVMFGLMNEPYGLSPDDWLGIVSRTLRDIRRAAAQNLVLLPGIAYAGAHSWVSSGNGAMEKLKTRRITSLLRSIST